MDVCALLDRRPGPTSCMRPVVPVSGRALPHRTSLQCIEAIDWEAAGRTFLLPRPRPPRPSRPVLLDSHRDGRISVVKLRDALVGPLDPIAQRLVGSSPLAWIQELRIDRRAGSGALHFEAEFDPSRLHGTGDFVLAETIDGTVISCDGDLMIGIPGIGRLIERQIVPLLLHRLDIEAKALDGYLRQLAR